MEGVFSKDDLMPLDWQYSVSHDKASCFKAGEAVFLKSNPNIKLTVHSANEATVTIIFQSESDRLQIHEFPPQCLLQYRYAGLLTYNRKYSVSLN